MSKYYTIVDKCPYCTHEQERWVIPDYSYKEDDKLICRKCFLTYPNNCCILEIRLERPNLTIRTTNG
tara:strand:+ start:565 stop:765 length:201 start_codon:yes stop_codon:yes gene_type:complete